MPKETFYFSHDYDARRDEKIKLLIRKHSMLGYGIFWALVEDLYTNANVLRTDYEGIAFDMRTDEKIIKSIINDFGLFEVKNGIFSSNSVAYRLNERNIKSQKASKSANSRWGNERNANALPTQSEGNAIKERKGKENKEKRKGFKFSEDFEFVFFKEGDSQRLGNEQKELARIGGILPLLIIEGSIY
jgi:spore cortex formation protein SpoVR/YcgB (stage V sporulation)